MRIRIHEIALLTELILSVRLDLRPAGEEEGRTQWWRRGQQEAQIRLDVEERRETTNLCVWCACIEGRK